MTTRDSPAADGAIQEAASHEPSYRARIKAEGRIAVPTIVALSVGGITFLAGSLPLLGVLALVVVATIPGAMPPGAG